ncbi:MAG TPA: hypothetical protein ENG31_03060 [Candidatus Thorarchaeota archaeon]|nr:hypothetical protein [Candidatus Thorarchaeota archaeon]
MGVNVAAFDAKSFRRGIPGSSVSHEFYTPLGTGIEVADVDEFEQAYAVTYSELSESFGIDLRRPCCDSITLKRQLGMKRVIPFADQLVSPLSPHISRLFISYVILPPSRIPTVNVGGHHSTVRTIETPHFLRRLEPAFSYLTAWAFVESLKRMGSTQLPLIWLDGFS